MKNIIKSTLLLLCSVCMFTACNDDLDHNPVLQSPTTFKLNNPAYAAIATDLASSTSLPFTWSQPDYGFPVAAEYELQVSTKNDWSISDAQAAADESGETIPTYVSVGTPTGECATSIDAADVAKAMQQMEQWPEGQVPSTQVLYVRAVSTLAGNTIYSNVVEINTVPYYVELKDAAPLLWYAVGSFIGGGWGNGADQIGNGLMPMFPAKDAEFDKKTGLGIIDLTFYIPEGGQFKFVQIPGNWDIQKNYADFFGDGTNEYFESNSDGNLCLKEGKAGYYVATFNTANDEISIEPATGIKGTVYNSIAMPGSHNDWNAASTTDALTLCGVKDGGESHIWMGNFKLSACELKFAANGNWDVNWGAAGFPYGVGVQNGSNIPVSEGDYTVFLNDLTGQYMFISK
jgi:hypothetical protein